MYVILELEDVPEFHAVYYKSLIREPVEKILQLKIHEYYILTIPCSVGSNISIVHAQWFVWNTDKLI